MLKNWFNASVIYEKTAEEGKIVKVTESYLVDALNFTEAETRMHEEMKSFISGEFVVSKVSRARIAELFANENGDKWYKSRVAFISLDEEKRIEKRTISTRMVQANTVKEAFDGITEGMKGTMSEYEIESIVKTKIEDVFHYIAPEEASEENKEE